MNQPQAPVLCGVRQNWKRRRYLRRLGAARSNLVCTRTKVFGKNRVNSSLNSQQKGRFSAPFLVPYLRQLPRIAAPRLALRELERLARLGLAVLLALDRAAIAGKESALLQDAAQFGLEIGQRLGDAVTDRTGLAGQTA